jgi:hypothetical protein
MLLGGYLFYNDLKHFFSYAFIVLLEVYLLVIIIYNVVDINQLNCYLSLNGIFQKSLGK